MSPDDQPDGGGTLVEYAVGKNGDIYPEGAGKLMKAGSKIRFNMHYHSVGEAITDRSQVGIVFYPKGYVPKHVMNTVLAPNADDLDIPAGADNVRSDAYYKMENRRASSASCRTCTIAASVSASRRSIRAWSSSSSTA